MYCAVPSASVVASSRSGGGKPVIGVHHLEGHLLSPLLASPATEFPFVALLVSGGHTQLMRVEAPGQYELLGETLDDAAGEAFDKTAQLLGLGYPGGPAVSRLATFGDAGAVDLPRPLRHSGDLNFSFSGLKTAVLTATRRLDSTCDQARADLARGFVDAGHEVLLAAPANSSCPVPRVAGTEDADEEAPLCSDTNTELRHAITSYAAMSDVDLIHDHTASGPLLHLRNRSTPVVTTLHGPFDPKLAPIYGAFHDVSVIAISHHQAATAVGVRVARVIHHGIDMADVPEDSKGFTAVSK